MNWNWKNKSTENDDEPVLADDAVRQKWEARKLFVSQNWLRYLALIATGTLTYIAGWTLTHNYFTTAMLVALAEGASLFWTARTEDNGNPTQESIAKAGIVISWAAIIATDLSSATILANMANQALIEAAKKAGQDPTTVKLVFSLFDKVPTLAQQIVTYIIPVLAVTHGILGTNHYRYSEDARLKRDMAKAKRDAMRQIAQARADAEKNIAQAQANRFKEIADQKAEGIGVAAGEKLWNNTYRNVNLSDNLTLASDVQQVSNVRQTKKSKTGNNGHNTETFEETNP